MKKFFFAIAILCALGFLATFAVQSSYHGKAKLIQRIEKSASADLFGDAGTPIGEPAEYVIEDPKAFIGGPDDKGVYQVDEGYLKAHQIYPTQLKTIDFFTGAFRIGFGIAGVIAALIAWRMKLKSSN